MVLIVSVTTFRLPAFRWCETRLVKRTKFLDRGDFLEKLIIAQLVNKFTACSAFRKFITVFSRFRHWTVSWASLIQLAVILIFILTCASHLGPSFSSGLLRSEFPIPYHPVWWETSKCYLVKENNYGLAVLQHYASPVLGPNALQSTLVTK